MKFSVGQFLQHISDLTIGSDLDLNYALDHDTGVSLAHLSALLV